MNFRSLMIKSLCFAFVLASCSVKEDRSSCPCILRLDVSDGERFQEKEFMLQIASVNSAVEVRGNVSVYDFPKGYDILVSKGLKSVSALLGHAGCQLSGTRLTAGEGKCFEPVFFYNDLVPCLEETASDTVRLHKEFAGLIVEFVDFENRKFNLDLYVVSPVNGFDIQRARPLKGEMKARLISDKDKASYEAWMPFSDIDTLGRSNRLFRFLVPRQNDGTLVLEILRKSGEILDTLPIGQMLMDVGYNWENKDLDDAIIRIDSSKSEINIVISDWETGVSKEFTI